MHTTATIKIAMSTRPTAVRTLVADNSYPGSISRYARPWSYFGTESRLAVRNCEVGDVIEVEHDGERSTYYYVEPGSGKVSTLRDEAEAIDLCRSWS